MPSDGPRPSPLTALALPCHRPPPYAHRPPPPLPPRPLPMPTGRSTPSGTTAPTLPRSFTSHPTGQCAARLSRARRRARCSGKTRPTSSRRRAAVRAASLSRAKAALSLAPSLPLYRVPFSPSVPRPFLSLARALSLSPSPSLVRPLGPSLPLALFSALALSHRPLSPLSLSPLSLSPLSRV